MPLFREAHRYAKRISSHRYAEHTRPPLREAQRLTPHTEEPLIYCTVRATFHRPIAQCWTRTSHDRAGRGDCHPIPPPRYSTESVQGDCHPISPPYNRGYPSHAIHIMSARCESFHPQGIVNRLSNPLIVVHRTSHHRFQLRIRTIQSRSCLSLNYVYKNPIMEVFVIELCIRKSNRGSVCHPIRCEACGAPQLNPVKGQLPIAKVFIIHPLRGLSGPTSQLPIAGRATIGHPPPIRTNPLHVIPT